MTTSVLSVQASARPSDVRKWAIENGLPAGGTRGRMPRETTKAYNAVHAVKYTGHFVPTTPVETRDARGRKVVRKVSERAARQVLAQHGYSVPRRGTLSREQLRLALALV